MSYILTHMGGVEQIMDAPRIGYFGKNGSNSQIAAENMHRGELRGYPSIPALFKAVADEELEHAVVPIENSVEGSVGITNDLLYRENLFISAEYYMKITHCLIARPEVEKREIRTVLSHPQALGQCSSYISQNGFETLPFADTASAVSALSDERYAESAAIAGARAASIYGMRVLEHDIGDFKDNYTRFISLSGESGRMRKDVPMKASIVVSLEDTPGSLMRALEIFSRHGVNLTRVESRPVKFSPWKYIFFMDAQITSESTASLEELRSSSLNYKFLGFYPASKL